MTLDDQIRDALSSVEPPRRQEFDLVQAQRIARGRRSRQTVVSAVVVALVAAVAIGGVVATRRSSAPTRFSTVGPPIDTHPSTTDHRHSISSGGVTTIARESFTAPPGARTSGPWEPNAPGQTQPEAPHHPVTDFEVAFQVWNVPGSVGSVSSWIEANQSGELVFAGSVTEGASWPYLAFVPATLEGRQRDWYPVVEVQVVPKTATSVWLQMWVVTSLTSDRRHSLSIPTIGRRLTITELPASSGTGAARPPVTVTDANSVAAVGTLLDSLPTKASSTARCSTGAGSGYLLTYTRTGRTTPDATITVRTGTDDSGGSCGRVDVTAAGKGSIALRSSPELLAMLKRLTS